MMNETLYRKKVLGCWLGKAVGGTLGAPVEGWRGPHRLSYYDPVPETMLPNDDLDLQVVWACVLNQMEHPVVSAEVLAQAWLDYVDFPWDEYGVGIRNLRNNIRPPFSGSYDNWFADGMGAAIRSELWACLAPGDPELAGRYARQDACVDHAGSGMWAEVFLAAMEAAAFTCDDIGRIIDAGLQVLPVGSALRDGIEGVRRQYAEFPNFDSLFKYIMTRHRGDNFTDVKLNLPIIAAALLLGEGDFDKSICYAVNFGEDTDCTGATVGALLGIRNPDTISERWLAPIGHDLVLSPQIHNIHAPATLDDFAAMICNLRHKVKLDDAAAQTYAPQPVAARIGTRRHRRAPEPELRPVCFDGCWARGEQALQLHEELFVEIPFQVPVAGEYEIMLNTKSEVQVFVDGRLMFRRESGGSLAPSFHRVPWNQSNKCMLAAGRHCLRAIISDPSGKVPEWVAGIGYGDSQQWVPDAFKLD